MSLLPQEIVSAIQRALGPSHDMQEKALRDAETLMFHYGLFPHQWSQVVFDQMARDLNWAPATHRHRWSIFKRVLEALEQQRSVIAVPNELRELVVAAAEQAGHYLSRRTNRPGNRLTEEVLRLDLGYALAERFGIENVWAEQPYGEADGQDRADLTVWRDRSLITIEIKYFRVPPGGSNAPLTQCVGQYLADMVKVARFAAPSESEVNSISPDESEHSSPPGAILRFLYVVGDSAFTHHLERHYPDLDVFNLPSGRPYRFSATREELPETTVRALASRLCQDWKGFSVSFAPIYQVEAGDCSAALVEVFAAESWS